MLTVSVDLVLNAALGTSGPLMSARAARSNVCLQLSQPQLSAAVCSAECKQLASCKQYRDGEAQCMSSLGCQCTVVPKGLPQADPSLLSGMVDASKLAVGLLTASPISFANLHVDMRCQQLQGIPA